MSLYIVRSPAVAARSLGGEMIVMSMRDSTLFTLNETAKQIWEAADGRTPLEEIVRHGICDVFEVGPEQAYADAEALCRDLAHHGILLISEQPVASADARL